MKLRLKTLLVVAVSMTVLFVALFLLIRFSLEDQFAALERHAAQDDIGRVEAALLDDVRQLDRISADWAPRDQTYRFMRGEDPAFLSELSEEALNNLGVNLMTFLDIDGNVVHAESFDLDLGVRQAMDGSVQRTVLTSPDLQNPADPRSRVTGVLRSGDKLLLVAARSVTSSDLYSPPAGTLVLARYIDSAEVERIAGDVRGRHPIVVDDMVINMVDVGEETGELDTMLYKVADTFDEEVAVLTDSLTSLMEPLLIIVLGGIVGFIVVALFMPLIALIQKLS